MEKPFLAGQNIANRVRNSKKQALWRINAPEKASQTTQICTFKTGCSKGEHCEYQITSKVPNLSRRHPPLFSMSSLLYAHPLWACQEYHHPIAPISTGECRASHCCSALCICWLEPVGKALHPSGRRRRRSNFQRSY